MIKTVTILIAVIALFINSAKADTVSYWQIYHNDVKIKEYSQYSKGEIILKIKDIKKEDSLTIQYICDTPCPDCLTTVSIKDENDFQITEGKGTGTFCPVKVSLFELRKKAGKGFYNVHYYEELKAEQQRNHSLFSIKLE